MGLFVLFYVSHLNRLIQQGNTKSKIHSHPEIKVAFK